MCHGRFGTAAFRAVRQTGNAGSFGESLAVPPGSN